MTQADETLIAEVSELGESVTARQLKELRAHRLIPSAQGPGAGQGPGRPSKAYPEGTPERVAHIRRIQRTERAVKLAELPVWLFLDGSDADLDRAIALTIEWHKQIAAAYPHFDKHEPDTIVDALQEFLDKGTQDPDMRALRNLLGIKSAQPGTDFREVVEALLWSSLGLPLAQDTHDRLAATVPTGLPELISGFEFVLEDNNFHHLVQKIEKAETEDLVWARDRRLNLISIAKAFLDSEEFLGFDTRLRTVLNGALMVLNTGPFDDMMAVVQIARTRPFTEPIIDALNEVFTSNPPPNPAR